MMRLGRKEGRRGRRKEEEEEEEGRRNTGIVRFKERRRHKKPTVSVSRWFRATFL
jgi:hypothetical protein